MRASFSFWVGRAGRGSGLSAGGGGGGGVVTTAGGGTTDLDCEEGAGEYRATIRVSASTICSRGLPSRKETY